MNDTITLVKKSYLPDETGELVSTTTTRDVFAKVESVGMKEFYEAMAQGLKPEVRFVIFDHLDYQGERTVEYLGDTFTVIRTYRKNLTSIELVCAGVVNE